MPFRKYTPYFEPEELETLTAAFDVIWLELSTSGVDLSTEEKVARMKKNLAQRILVSATVGGVRDVETLREQAMRSLGGGRRLATVETHIAPVA